MGEEEPAMMRITTTTLSCGTPLVVETIPGVRSAGLTWLLPAGCAADPAEFEGISTMWAELICRGAGARDSRAHADALDRLGAGRSTDVGTFYLRVGVTTLGDRLLETLPLVVDMVRRPRMEAGAVEPARDLALQAIESLKDDPQQRAMLAARARHHPVPLNRSGLGTPEGLRAVTGEALVSGWARAAVPGRSILAAAGAVDPAALAGLLDDQLRGWAGSIAEPAIGPAAARGYGHEADESNQVQVVVVHDAPPEPAEDSLLEKIVVSVLSGGMSGRLFTEVREKRGLCYSVSAGYRGDRDYGAVSAYVGTTPERAQESLDVLTAELVRLHTADGRITPDEFRRAVVGMKSRLIFSGESTAARAAALAADMHKFRRPRSLDELAQKVDAVTLDQVNAYLARRRMGTLTIQTVGPAELRPPLLRD